MILSLFAAAISVCGFSMAVKARAFFLLHPVKYLKTLFSGDTKRGVGPWAALSVSLAGVLGVGNIAGVCVAMALGGPGAIFWMWISALLSMPLKYAEIYLGVKYARAKGSVGGSPMLYTEGLQGGRSSAKVYAVLCLAAALTLGNVTQTGAVAEALANGFSIPRVATGIAVAAFAAFIIIGKFEKLARLTSAVVPAMSLTYIILCAAAIFGGAGRIPAAFSSVIKGAFSLKSAGGGILGTTFASALRHGTVKGCFSHEAGSGTAVFAHTHSCSSPEKQACFGIFEVFFDTSVICSLTAFAVLASGVDPANFGYAGTDCILSAFEIALGAGAGKAVSLCISLFAFATVLCWSSYGLTALRYLTGSKRASSFYLIIYCTAAVAGSVMRAKAVWIVTDASVLSLTALNLSAIMRRRSEVMPPDFA